jgi:Flp pilus assembly protein TadD
VELHPADRETRALLANMLLARGRVSEALPHMMVLSSGAPSDTNLIYLTGAALMHERRYGEAVPYLRRTLDLNPAQPKAWSYLGIAARALGDTAAAEVYYQRAIALDPRFARREQGT